MFKIWLKTLLLLVLFSEGAGGVNLLSADVNALAEPALTMFSSRWFQSTTVRTKEFWYLGSKSLSVYIFEDCKYCAKQMHTQGSLVKAVKQSHISEVSPFQAFAQDDIILPRKTHSMHIMQTAPSLVSLFKAKYLKKYLYLVRLNINHSQTWMLACQLLLFFIPLSFRQLVL